MRTMEKNRKRELSLIYLTAALLVVAVVSLAGKATVTATATATVQPEPYPRLYACESNAQPSLENKVAYFTFDDGPSRNTAAILDVLEKQQANATFFVTAQNADAPYTEEALCRMVGNGHTVGLHSYSHEFDCVYRSVDTYLADLDQLNTWLYTVTGAYPQILRFPGGSASMHARPETMQAIITEVKRRGYRYYDWHVVSGDDGSPARDAHQLAETIVAGALERDAAVILMHDGAAATTGAQALDLAIDRLREEGYCFEALTGAVQEVHLVSQPQNTSVF